MSERSKYNWIVSPEDRALTELLSQGLAVPRLIARLLALRGVSTLESGKRFLIASASNISEPGLLTDMERAVERVASARTRDESVLVFGDYDVDGISGTALLTRALRRFGLTHCACALPNRQTEGYGLGPEHVEVAHDQGVKLIITVDNGINAHAAATRTRELGIDLIITDHHELPESLPEAYAVINPKRDGAAHPAAWASGSVVASKLATALTGDMHDLELTTLGLVADIVPLLGENRDIAALGLQSLRKTSRPGLVALSQIAKIRIDEITSESIAFQLAPRINAGGRLGDGRCGLELLLTDSTDVAKRCAAELDAANVERRSIERAIFEQARQRVTPDQSGIVLADPSWHQGVVGIVAARIQSAFYRPTILIALGEDGVGRGSARGITELDLVEILTSCQRHLVKFGGHKAAAGITILETNVEAFAAAFNEEVARRTAGLELRPSLNIDAQVSLNEIDHAVVNSLQQLQPFGQGNPSPMFCTYGASIVPDSVREMRGGHLKLWLRNGSRIHTAIGFGMAERIPELRTRTSVDIAFAPQFNTWKDKTEVQLVLKDIQPAYDRRA